MEKKNTIDGTMKLRPATLAEDADFYDWVQAILPQPNSGGHPHLEIVDSEGRTTGYGYITGRSVSPGVSPDDGGSVMLDVCLNTELIVFEERIVLESGSDHAVTPDKGGE